MRYANQFRPYDSHPRQPRRNERLQQRGWKLLNFEENTGGYVVPFTREQLEQAPAHGITELTENDGRKVRDISFSYYKVDKAA